MNEHTTDERVILVAVAGADAGLCAVRHAALDASLHGGMIRIVHVSPQFAPLTALYPMALPYTFAQIEQIGTAILERAVKEAGRYLPVDRVTTTLATGDPVFGILGAAEHVSSIVLGDDRSSVARRVATGSIVGGVAARADVPVVVVPSSWEEAAPRGRVLLGVKAFDRVPPALLSGALALASARDAALEVVHVWDPPAVYGEQVLASLDYPDWATAVEGALARSAEPIAKEFPDTDLIVTARYGRPVEVLEQLSAHADLLVVARRASLLPTGHFGSTGRALLRGTQCPLVVLPVAEAERSAVAISERSVAPNGS